MVYEQSPSPCTRFNFLAMKTVYLSRNENKVILRRDVAWCQSRRFSPCAQGESSRNFRIWSLNPSTNSSYQTKDWRIPSKTERYTCKQTGCSVCNRCRSRQLLCIWMEAKCKLSILLLIERQKENARQHLSRIMYSRVHILFLMCSSQWFRLIKFSAFV